LGRCFREILIMYVLKPAARHLRMGQAIVVTLLLHTAVYRVRQMQPAQDVNFIN